ncbi:hypothetical protein GBAR_LOCUS19064 [Geodia barretti]|uniref:Uncharacterized protein n=1 Tax=Geodia barretti TaxID=519541 RepID=A0AA35SQM5_GEOBA|nr:hypothetical protein GBAR_LOCUS19064 [Geodia barretti]
MRPWTRSSLCLALSTTQSECGHGMMGGPYWNQSGLLRGINWESSPWQPTKLEQWEPAVVWMVVSGHGTSPQENVSGVLTEVQWMCGHSPSPLTHSS